MDSRDEGRIQRAEATEELLLIALYDQSPDKQVRVSSRLNPQDLHALTTTLRQNADILAWSATDIPGISPEVIVHRLNVSPSCRPIRQKRRQLIPKRSRAMQDEVTKLIEADLIHEVYYPEWLMNVILVKKPNGK